MLQTLQWEWIAQTCQIYNQLLLNLPNFPHNIKMVVQVLWRSSYTCLISKKGKKLLQQIILYGSWEIM